MKKNIMLIAAIVCIVITALLSFLLGRFVGTVRSSESDKPYDNNSTDDQNNKDGEPIVEDKVFVNVFFSPHTGSDENGNGSSAAPFESEKKAKEYAKTLNINNGEEIAILEFLMSIDIKTSEASGVFSSVGGINMIPFTGSTRGYYFEGETVGIGCDTQKYGNDGSVLFSARYLLKGKDYKGQSCSVFIENNGSTLDKCTPTIITDSTALADWQTADLRTIVTPVSGGVTVEVYRFN